MTERQLDVLFVNPNSSKECFQDLAETYSAIEPPVWSLLLAKACLVKGFGAAILDCDAERLNDQQSLERIQSLNPRLVCFVVYGSNPSSGYQFMSGTIRLANLIKENDSHRKIAGVGTYFSADPQASLAYKAFDIVLIGEGVYALLNLLASDLNHDLSTIKGIGWKNSLGFAQINPSEKLVSTELMDRDLPGSAWELLPYKNRPLDLYRSHFWHTNYDHKKRSPFGALYTSLGCVKKCNFCLDGKTKIITSRRPNCKATDIVKGDYLMGWDEKTSSIAETQVIEISNRKANILYKITTNEGQTIKATGEHPFFMNGRWIDCRNLVVGDKILVINHLDKISFNKKVCNPNGDGSKKRLPVDPTIKEKNRKKTSERMKQNNPMFRGDVRERVSKTNRENFLNGTNIPYLSTPDGIAVIKEKARERMLSDLNPSLTEENRQKTSERMSGSNHPKWKGGRSKVYKFYSKEFIKSIRYEIKARDNYECKECGRTDLRLHAHHIDFDRSNNEKCNLITLCGSCHPKTNGSDRDFWVKRYKDKILELGYTDCPHYIEIKSIEVLEGEFEVYNFQCEPHNNFFAEYILTHNCVINQVNRTDYSEGITSADSAMMRFWSPEFMITEFDKLAKMGVETIRISDEMFFLNRRYYEPLLQMIVDRQYKVDSWAYCRYDTCKPQHLDLFKKAGINWLGVGIESANLTIRQEAVKGNYEDVSIKNIVKTIENHGIEVGANYIFGFPNETEAHLQQTLDLAIELNTAFANFYTCTYFPGTPLYNEAKSQGWQLPEKFEEYAFLGYSYVSLPTIHMSREEVLRFRDNAWHKYFENPSYLSMMEAKFGLEVRQNIEKQSKIRLKRKLLGD